MPEFYDFTSSPYDYDDDSDHLYFQPDSDLDPEPLTDGLSDSVSWELLAELMPF